MSISFSALRIHATTGKGLVRVAWTSQKKEKVLSPAKTKKAQSEDSSGEAKQVAF